MYPLGKQFQVDYSKAKSDKKAVVQGSRFRITVISERIVRLEYSPDGQFLDKPTQLVRRRNIGIPDFSVRQDANVLEINTKYFALNYIKEHFKGVTFSPPEGTYMLFLDCTDWCKENNKTIIDVEKAAWKVGVAVQDGKMFNGPCHLRLNLALPLSKVKEAFERLDKYVFNPK